MEKFSFSKLSTYSSCPFKFKLQYRDKHFPDSTTLANEFGTLIHYVEETIAKDIIANDNEPIFMMNNDKYIDIFLNCNSEDSDNKKILGVKALKLKYGESKFREKDKNGFSYDDKVKAYLDNGINRLQNYLDKNRNLRIVGIEKSFELEHDDYIFHGFIDRVFKDIETGQIIVEDIKTWDSIDDHDLVTPLQFVLYAIAANKIFDSDDIICRYDLPLIDKKYSAGTNGYIKRGVKKIDKILNEIKSGNFEPRPSPLCHWCVFSPTYIEGQPEDAKNLCPYFCHWTRSKKDFSIEFEWAGLENHKNVLEAYMNKNKDSIVITKTDSKQKTPDNSRRFILRR